MKTRDLDIILTHERTDFDALASLLAASLLFPEAVAVLPRQMNRNVRDFYSLYRNRFRFVAADEAPKGRVRRVILVDTRSANSPKGTQADTEYIVIDHHTALEEKDLISEARRPLPHARQVWSGPTGANTTLLVEKLIEYGIPVDPVQATLLALGIYEDTGNLTYASTTSRDAAALAWLLEPERGVSLREVNEFLHHPITDEQRKLLQTLMERCEFHEIAGHNIIVTTAPGQPDFADELSTLAARLRDFHEPDALFMLVDLGDMVQLVARSTTDSVDVGKIARALGGGGHNRAAAAHLRGARLDTVRMQVLNLVREYSRAAVTVRQIMSAGRPKILAPDLSVRQAAELMRRFGHEGFPVVEEDAGGHETLIGVLTRRDADRALDHGLGDQPVRRFMSAGQHSVRPQDSITMLRRMMIDSNWGQILVVDDRDEIVGIVTRTDLIKLWDEASLPSQRAGEITRKLRRALNPVQHHLLERVGQEVDRMSYAVYVVGGFVRDLMLDAPDGSAPTLDVDIVIEGDAIAFARRMQAIYGGRVVDHKRFGTAKWQLSDPETPADVGKLLAGLEIPASQGAALLPSHLDFVTARTEFYTEPTALPTVQQSSIKLDLHRRDFTINTLALALNPDRWGELLDFWGGLADLSGGWVRVLHSLSFVDDPTRILRAVRYEQRFGFRIEPRTLELLGDALELLDRVTPARIRHELERILQEDAPEKTLVRLDRLDILRQLDPDLRVTPALPSQFAALRRLLAEPEVDPVLRAEPVERLYWAILIDPLPGEVHERLQARLGLRGETQKIMRDMSELRVALPVLSDPEARPSQIVLALDEVGPVALALAPLLYPDEMVRARIAQYRSTWQAVRPELDGTDLRRLGIPRGAIYRVILRELRARRIDGTLHSREEEEALVRELTIDN